MLHAWREAQIRQAQNECVIQYHTSFSIFFLSQTEKRKESAKKTFLVSDRRRQKTCFNQQRHVEHPFSGQNTQQIWMPAECPMALNWPV